MFKVGDKVFSVTNGETTDQIGTVKEVNETEVIVVPDSMPWVKFSYNLDGTHNEPSFSIKKATELN